jgi:hypothetical protein
VKALRTDVTELSHQTLKAFIDYLYLGQKALMPDNCNPYHLLTKAYDWQLPDLIDCCTNLISLKANPQDADTISTLANRYDNDHLRRLATHLHST